MKILFMLGFALASSSSTWATVDTTGMTPQQVADPVVLSESGLHPLLATWAMQTPGIPRRGPEGDRGGFKAKNFWIEKWADPQQRLAWNVQSPSAASYRVTFLIDCAKGRSLTLSGPENSVVFTAPEQGWQRVESPAALRLPGGRSVIGLALNDGGTPVRLKSLELLDTRDEVDLQHRVQAFKGDAAWLKEAGYGIMVQSGGWAYPPHGDKKPWPGFAEDFGAAAFVEKVDEMGGTYLVWSATWCDYLFPAPISAIGEILPQRVSRRDLIGNLITECRKRHIRFMLYYHLGHYSQEVMKAKGWPADDVQTLASRQEWLGREMKILSEVGLRYGTGLDAVFLDDACCWYPADFEKLGAAVKAGNPQRLVCYNPWVAASHTPFQDFWCGEGFDGMRTPYPLTDGLVDKGPQKGMQLFGNFIFDGPDWGVRKAETRVNPPRLWSVDRLVDMTRRLEKERYSVAINILLFEDGSIGEESYQLLKAAATRMQRGKWAARGK